LSFGELIDLGQQPGAAFDPLSPGALIAAISLGELAQAGPLFRWHGKELGLTLLAARQNPSLVEKTLSTTAGRLTALSAQQVEGAWRHRAARLELAQETAQGGEGSPKLLPLTREVRAQSVLHNILTDTDNKQKMMRKSENSKKSFPSLPGVPFTAKINPSSPLSESQ